MVDLPLSPEPAGGQPAEILMGNEHDTVLGPRASYLRARSCILSGAFSHPPAIWRRSGGFSSSFPPHPHLVYFGRHPWSETRTGECAAGIGWLTSLQPGIPGDFQRQLVVLSAPRIDLEILPRDDPALGQQRTAATQRLSTRILISCAHSPRSQLIDRHPPRPGLGLKGFG